MHEAQNLNCKFKKFGFLETLKIHIHFLVQLPCKDYFISPSNKYRKNSKLMLMLFFSFRFEK